MTYDDVVGWLVWGSSEIGALRIELFLLLPPALSTLLHCSALTPPILMEKWATKTRFQCTFRKQHPDVKSSLQL